MGHAESFYNRIKLGNLPFDQWLIVIRVAIENIHYFSPKYDLPQILTPVKGHTPLV
jgi:hypothetical protein